MRVECATLFRSCNSSEILFSQFVVGKTIVTIVRLYQTDSFVHLCNCQVFTLSIAGCAIVDHLYEFHILFILAFVTFCWFAQRGTKHEIFIAKLSMDSIDVALQRSLLALPCLACLACSMRPPLLRPPLPRRSINKRSLAVGLQSRTEVNAPCTMLTCTVPIWSARSRCSLARHLQQKTKHSPWLRGDPLNFRSARSQ